MIIELIAVLFTLICVYLATRQNIWSWPFGLVGVTAYFIIFIQAGLWAQVGLQVIFFAQNVYGWWNWKFGKSKTEETLKVTILTNTQRLWTLLILIGGTFLGYMGLTYFTPGNLPLCDAFTAIAAIIATWLLAKKKWETWWLWILVDVILVLMFLSTSLYLSTGLYFIFFINAIYGLFRWKKDLKTVSSPVK
jgi:nicotinamide mononucleotide transporter